jgi:serine/threonine-protein kinase RsbW
MAVPESLSLLHELLELAGEEHPDVESSDLWMFETAVIEIAGNVLEHGGPAGEVRYSFDLRIEPDRLVGLLADSGQALPPDVGDRRPGLWDEHGRGLQLARDVLDGLDYTRDADENRWVMTRVRRAGTS